MGSFYTSWKYIFYIHPKHIYHHENKINEVKIPIKVGLTAFENIRQ